MSTALSIPVLWSQYVVMMHPSEPIPQWSYVFSFDIVQMGIFPTMYLWGCYSPVIAHDASFAKRLARWALTIVGVVTSIHYVVSWLVVLLVEAAPEIDRDLWAWWTVATHMLLASMFASCVFIGMMMSCSRTPLTSPDTSPLLNDSPDASSRDE